MKLTFTAADLEYNIRTIFDFLEEAEDEFFKEPIFGLYPQIDRQEYNALSGKKQKTGYLNAILSKTYSEKNIEIKEKAELYQKHWDGINGTVENGLSEVFGMSLSDKFNGMQSNVGLNPICPRYLDGMTFDIIYLCSPQGMAAVAVHEIIHFIWFSVWHGCFKDEKTEYENPHIKWVFSEMVPDMIMKKAGLGFLLPEGRSTIYPYFNDISIFSEPILRVLEELLETRKTEDFMKEGFALCKENEDIIRKAMA